MADLEMLSNELDSQLGSIGATLRTLNDVENLFMQLTEDMEEAVHRGEERFHFQEHHRTIRVLSKLMYHAMNEINEHYEKAEAAEKELFNTVHEKQESHNAGNVVAL
jgi:hypothetical protein